MSLTVAGDRKTAYISRILPFAGIGNVNECRRLSPGLSSRLSSIPLGAVKYLAPISGADLELASSIECDITEDQLASILSLKGAKMPDGSIHE